MPTSRKFFVKVAAVVLSVTLFVVSAVFIKNYLFPLLPVEWQNELVWIGGAVAAMVTVLAGIAEFTGYSIRDLFPSDAPPPKARALLLQEIDHNLKYLSEVYHQVRSEQKKYRDTFQTDGMGGWSSEGSPLRTLTGFSPNILSQKVWTSEMLQASEELSQQELEAVFSFYGKMAQIVSAQEKFQRFMESKSTSPTRLVAAENLLEDVMNRVEDVLHHHPNPLLS